jgi:RimJ/RimL family protein N-acetyltransferase
MIEGRIVNLRAPEMADLERNQGWMNDHEVTRFLGGQARYPLSMAGEEAWLRGRCEQQMSYERAFFAIETKDGRHIGNTDLFNVAAEERRAELGIMIGAKDCWSEGYGRDAVQTLVRFGFEEMNLHRVVLQVFAYNPRGMACYRACGFVEEVRMRQDMWHEGAYHDTVVMGLLRADFEAREREAGR